ncbi:MAG: NADPH-dependent F420 reductase [Anaerolineales bacterium]|nr:NADPH-dependent F420 reductase [Anaerolineales bacterium]
MKIAMIGTGNVGRALGTGWAKKGHQVIFGSRNPHSEKVREVLAAAGANASAAGIAEAGAAAEVIVLATPWNIMEQIVESLGNVAGKIVVDATNPIGPGFQLAVGMTSSGAEQIAGWAKGGRVVKAFNTTGWENMADPIYHGQPITMFICGDDAEARAVVAGLAEDLGFEVTDTGPLSTARYLEPLAMLWIHLATVQKQGRQMAFKIVKR